MDAADMNSHDATEKVLQSTTSRVLAALAVITTPALLGAIWWFGSAWLDERFDTLNKNQSAISLRVENVQNAIDANTANDRLTHDRLIIAEQNIQAAREDRERFQKEALDSLQQLQASTGKLAENVAALNATMQERQQRENRRP